jgi:imidazolonepropionase-like amidohydrolase
MRAGWLFVIAACGAAPSPEPRLASPAAQVRYPFLIQNQPAGELTVAIAADGARDATSDFHERGAREVVHTHVELDARGAPRSFRATGKDHFGQPIEEQLDTVGGVLRWRTAGDHGQAPAGSGWYLPMHATDDLLAALARAVLAAPDHRVKLLPSGEARLADDTAHDFADAGGHLPLRRVALTGLGFAPVVLWLDDHRELFAHLDGAQTAVRDGHAALTAQLAAADARWLAERTIKQQAFTHHPPPAGLAITHARLFDSERRTIIADASVVVQGDRITAVGDARLPLPPGAEVIDAHGRTLIPGLWDMHVHLGDGDGILHLASGVTTVRDMGNDPSDLDPRVARFDAGDELGPNVLRAGLIDGPSPQSAGVGKVVDSRGEAQLAVDAYATTGYVQIKIYNSVPPTLVPVIANAAHARGLRVSGHVPNTMNAAQAVEAGYDELQHINFVFLRFLAGPTDDTRTQLRVTRVAERGADLDLASPEVNQFLDLLIAHHTVVDTTLTVFHNMFTADPGELDPVYAPYADRLPAQVVRGARSGGLATTSPAQRAKFRASYAALMRMVKLLWDRKIPITTGTDYYAGFSLPHELELDVRAGIPPADVLALATIGDARIMGVERDVGSIAVGKRADLVLLDGDPTVDIAAVRRADVVVCRGRVYDPAALYASVGVRAR